MSSKPADSANSRRQQPAANRLFRPNAGVAAGAAGRRNYRHIAGIGRRVRGFPDRRQPADTARHRILPVCRSTARCVWPVVVLSGAAVGGVAASGAHLRCARMRRRGRGRRRRRRRRRLRVGPGGAPSAKGRKGLCDLVRITGETIRPRGGSAEKCELSGFAIANERKMPHRRHRPALGQRHAAMSGRPSRPAAPTEIPAASPAAAPAARTPVRTSGARPLSAPI